MTQLIKPGTKTLADLGLKAQIARSTARPGPVQKRGQKNPGGFPGRSRSTTNPAMQTQGVPDPHYGMTTLVQTGQAAKEKGRSKVSSIRGAVADTARRAPRTPSNAARKGGKVGWKTDSGSY